MSFRVSTANPDRVRRAASLAVMLGALSALGCADNESMLFIEGVLALDKSDCVLKPESNALLLPGGAMDRALANGYRAALLVGSQLTQRGSREQLRTETARLNLLGAEVTLETTGGVQILPAFTAIGTGFVNPSTGTEPGFGGLIVDIVPNGAEVPDGTIISKLRAFGETLGGDEIESNEFRFPISVCFGCLISYPASANDQPADAPYLCSISADEESSDTNVCYPGQDSVVSCTQCSAFNNVCRDPLQNPSAQPAAP